MQTYHTEKVNTKQQCKWGIIWDDKHSQERHKYPLGLIKTVIGTQPQQSFLLVIPVHYSHLKNNNWNHIIQNKSKLSQNSPSNCWKYNHLACLKQPVKCLKYLNSQINCLNGTYQSLTIDNSQLTVPFTLKQIIANLQNKPLAKTIIIVMSIVGNDINGQGSEMDSQQLLTYKSLSQQIINTISIMGTNIRAAIVIDGLEAQVNNSYNNDPNYHIHLSSSWSTKIDLDFYYLAISVIKPASKGQQLCGKWWHIVQKLKQPQENNNNTPLLNNYLNKLIRTFNYINKFESATELMMKSVIALFSLTLPTSMAVCAALNSIDWVALMLSTPNIIMNSRNNKIQKVVYSDKTQSIRYQLSREFGMQVLGIDLQSYGKNNRNTNGNGQDGRKDDQSHNNIKIITSTSTVLLSILSCLSRAESHLHSSHTHYVPFSAKSYIHQKGGILAIVMGLIGVVGWAFQRIGRSVGWWGKLKTSNKENQPFSTKQQTLLSYRLSSNLPVLLLGFWTIIWLNHLIANPIILSLLVPIVILICSIAVTVAQYIKTNVAVKPNMVELSQTKGSISNLSSQHMTPNPTVSLSGALLKALFHPLHIVLPSIMLALISLYVSLWNVGVSFVAMALSVGWIVFVEIVSGLSLVTNFILQFVKPKQMQSSQVSVKQE